MPTGNPPWNFKAIKKLPKVTGPWMLQVQKAGQYRITLRQFPKEADEPVVAERAKIEIAGQNCGTTCEKQAARVLCSKSISRPVLQN